MDAKILFNYAHYKTVSHAQEFIEQSLTEKLKVTA
jgi:hypothetical protein